MIDPSCNGLLEISACSLRSWQVSHLAVCALAGLDPVEMNILTALYCGYEPLTYTATRGWTQEQMTEALERLRTRGLVSGSSLS